MPSLEIAEKMASVLDMSLDDMVYGHLQDARNGYFKKQIKNSFGESSIQVPRDRDSSFNPILVPKPESMVDGIENVIVSLYAKGISNSDIEEQIREIYNFEIPTSTIPRITDRITEDIIS